MDINISKTQINRFLSSKPLPEVEKVRQSMHCNEILDSLRTAQIMGATDNMALGKLLSPQFKKEVTLSQKFMLSIGFSQKAVVAIRNFANKAE